jgi:hypothetical protein
MTGSGFPAGLFDGRLTTHPHPHPKPHSKRTECYKMLHKVSDSDGEFSEWVSNYCLLMKALLHGIN